MLGAMLARRGAVLLVLAACTREPPPAPQASSATATPTPTATGAIPTASTPASVTTPARFSERRAPDGMVAVAGGYFLMGSARGEGNPEERPMHEVAVADFFLDAAEVTVRAYRACVEAGRCVAPKPGPFCNGLATARDTHPVNCVDHRDATAFCAWAGGRLPTESEWEYAASGGAEGRRHAWGDAPPTRTTACYDHPGGTCPVASFPPGAFGLYDMNGNVWEWTASWFGWYPNEPETGRQRVFKGGSWSRWHPKWLRNKNRGRWPEDRHNAWLGLRCGRTSEPLACPDGSEARGERCVRVRGTPRCEPGLAYNGAACTPGGRPGVAIASDAAGLPGARDEPVTARRAPSFDADCVKLYGAVGLGVAYVYEGADFHARAPRIAARGCRRRDTGARWTGACCAQ
jgi:formylglycine-generating enzyme required for sulfatase activity